MKIYSNTVKMKAIVLVICTAVFCYARPPSARLIDGDDVKTQLFPYLVSIQTGLFEFEHTCSGAIISPSWVVTSASHCAGISLIISRVVAGTYDLNNIDNDTNVQIRTIDFYNVMKPSDNNNDLVSDVALLKMTQAFQFNEFVSAVKISKLPCFALDEPNTFSGWGTQNNSLVLQTANLTIVPFDQCLNVVQDAYGDNLPIREDMHICVIGNASACSLDTGGPLIQDNRMIGLLSWLPETCANKKIPSIFTNTGVFKNFIKEFVTDLPV